MVGSERHLVPYTLPYHGYILTEPIDPSVSDLDAGERVHETPQLTQIAGSEDGARLTPNQANAHIHLQEPVTHVQAPLQACRHPRRLRMAGGVAVAQDAIPELAAGQLIRRHTVGLSGQIHQRHLDGAHPTALAPVMPELLDLPEEPVNVARILSKESALQQQRIGIARPRLHFPIPADPLVRVESDNAGANTPAPEAGNSEVRYPELGRPRMAT